MNVFLHAGLIHVATMPTQITTILGSCVALALWDGVAGAGGMNHYMLPMNVGEGSDSPRYASYAIQQLVSRLIAAGAAKTRLQARLFGGACIAVPPPASGDHLGSRNVDAARRFLMKENIPIVSEHVGGTEGRKVIFCTDSGLAVVKMVHSNPKEARP